MREFGKHTLEVANADIFKKNKEMHCSCMWIDVSFSMFHFNTSKPTKK